MKKLINCYQSIISPENIWQAWLSYRRGKRDRQAVSDFEAYLENNLLSLQNDLISGNYQRARESNILTKNHNSLINLSCNVPNNLFTRPLAL